MRPLAKLLSLLGVGGAAALIVDSVRSAPSALRNQESLPASIPYKIPAEKNRMPIWRDVAFVSFIALPLYGFFRAMLCGYNATIVSKEDKERLRKILTDKERPIITVSNHHSTVDDPAVWTSVIPISETWKDPNRIFPWSLCASEICFDTTLHRSFFGYGRVRPIIRGDGLEQNMFLDYALLLRDKRSWIHIFPEGRCSPFAARGLLPDRLKWGVGKLIATATTNPVVLPVYHHGMRNILPLKPADHHCVSWLPRRKKQVFVKIGEPLEFGDLLEAHRVQVLTKYCGGSEERLGELDRQHWSERRLPEDERLYSAITARIREALLLLEEQVRAEIISKVGRVSWNDDIVD